MQYFEYTYIKVLLFIWNSDLIRSFMLLFAKSGNSILMGILQGGLILPHVTTGKTKL